jgi:hypothetical protein
VDDKVSRQHLKLDPESLWQKPYISNTPCHANNGYHVPRRCKNQTMTTVGSLKSLQLHHKDIFRNSLARFSSHGITEVGLADDREERCSDTAKPQTRQS